MAALIAAVERGAALWHGLAVGVLLQNGRSAGAADILDAVPLLVIPPGRAVGVLHAAHLTVCQRRSGG